MVFDVRAMDTQLIATSPRAYPVNLDHKGANLIYESREAIRQQEVKSFIQFIRHHKKERLTIVIQRYSIIGKDLEGLNEINLG